MTTSELELARQRISKAWLGHASIHGVGTNELASCVVVYLADSKHPMIPAIEIDAERLAKPFSVRFVESPQPRLAAF